MDLAQFAVSLATIGMSGVVAAVVTSRLTVQRESRQLRREKLESVFRAFNGYVVQLGVHWTPLVSAMAGKIAYNDALDMVTENGTAANPRHFEELEMLVAIYFPELNSHLDELVAIRDQANTVIADHKKTDRQVGPHPTPALRSIQELSMKLDGLEARFRRAVRSEAAKVNRKV